MCGDTEDIRWMTVDEASKYLRVTRATLYAYMKDEKLPFFYLAGTRNRRIKKSDVDALLVPGKPDDTDAADEADS